MKFKVLGASGGVASGLETTSYSIDDVLLLDAGTGVAQMTLDELLAVERVFLTHSHLDHIVSLPLMLDTRFGHDVPPLKVYLHQETLDALKAHIFNWVIWPDFSELKFQGKRGVEFVTMEHGEIVEFDGYHVQMIPVTHTVPCVAYRIERNGKSLAFTGDTSTTERLWAVLNQHKPLDLLVIECSFPNEDEGIAQESKHYCPKTLACDVGKLEWSTELGIVHIKPGYKAEISQELGQMDMKHRVRYLDSGQSVIL